MTSDTMQDEEIRELTPEEVEELRAEEERLEREREEMLRDLAMTITGKFQNRSARRKVKESEWLESQRLYMGKLSIQGEKTNRDNPFEGRSKRNRPDVNIVRSKTDIAIAQTYSAQFGTGSKNWDLTPSPLNRDPAAAESCRRMVDTITTQLEETKYAKYARRAMEDRAIMGTGILKGPVNTGLPRRAYRPIPGSNEWEPYITFDYRPSIQRTNPWFFYPDESTSEGDSLQDTIEIHPMSAFELKKYKDHPSFIPDAIQRVCEQRPEEYMNAQYSEYASLTESNPYIFKDKYLVIEYHGPITHTQLNRLGIEPTYDALDDEYYGEVWVCQGEVIRIELENIEAAFEVPYMLDVWQRDPASVFGFGVPIMMRDAQRVVNETWHMILDNSSISSGPQFGVLKDFIEPIDGEWELAPRKGWYLTDPAVGINQAIQFFNVPNVTNQLVPILQMAQQFSEEESCIPLIAAGLQSPQTTDTATGGLMQMQASTTLLDYLNESWSDNITERLISRMYAWNMQYNPDPAIKGDYEIDPRAGTDFKNKQLYLRDVERLSLEAAQNPQAAMMINMDQLYRARLEMMNLPNKGIIKSEEEVQAAMEAQAQQPNPEQIEMEAKAKELEQRDRELALEEARMAFEMGQQQQRELWDHEEKMTANYARTLEAEARVLTAQTEKEMELIKLAAKDEQFRAKLMADQELAMMTAENQAFIHALENSRKNREDMMDMDLKRRELEWKEKYKEQKYSDGARQ